MDLWLASLLIFCPSQRCCISIGGSVVSPHVGPTCGFPDSQVASSEQPPGPPWWAKLQRYQEATLDETEKEQRLVLVEKLS